MEKQKNIPVLRFHEFSDEWVVKAMNCLCIYKGMVRGPFGGTLKKEYFVDSGYKVYEQRNAIYKSTTIGNYYIDEKKYSELKRFAIKEGDFIISCSGTIGKIYEIPLNAPRGIINQALLKITTNPEVIKSLFFFHYFEWEKFQNKIIENTQGGAMINLVGMDIFREVKLLIPTLPEQTKIATFLTSIDERLNQLKQKKNLLEHYKKGLVQKIFAQDIRFSPDHGDEFPEWEIKPLGILAERMTLKNKEGNTNVLTISAQQGLVSQLEFFNKSVSAKDVSGYYLLKKDDFAYNKSYSNGYPMGAIKRLKYYEKGVVSTLYICFTFNDSVNLSFIEQYFESGIHNQEIEKVAQEGARNHGLLNIGLSDFFSTEIVLPCLDEQTKIANFLSTIDEKINGCNNQISKTEQYKKGLLQQMFV